MPRPKDLRIFSGTSHPVLAGAIAKELWTKLSEMQISRFACGEIYAKPAESVRGSDVFLIQTATHEVNEDYMELFIMIDSLERSFAGKITVVIPHFGYARQDRVASPREPISAKLFADLIATSGADHVITVQLHSDQTQGFFPFPVDNLNLRNMFAEYLMKKKLTDIVVVAPDAGAAKDAGRLAKLLDAPLAVLTKERPTFNVAEVTSVVGDVEGRTCILYDDMVDTAGSVCAAHQALIDHGANKDVYLVASHAVFSGPAVDRLRETNFKEVIVSDSIPVTSEKEFRGLTVLPIASLLARVIKCVHENKSVTEAL
ncbi:ribose-phosphate pyrophosphokinase [Candidatus Peregrinibacteria bacterium]|jgi:ribose-phosphate pyrophosphokinase|nr:ribose-phosphate pyrophosphokinase [Candidatus Peregrinibacteria bacterium]MBT4631693.1 ribose-phosphate pyrophosphokinase [Candidatus Peregrinibacteria bacterium]